eukprot:SAG31_NODE_1901_length_6958_cov_5.749526_3_plen_763_part_00
MNYLYRTAVSRLLELHPLHPGLTCGGLRCNGVHHKFSQKLSVGRRNMSYGATPSPPQAIHASSRRKSLALAVVFAVAVSCGVLFVGSPHEMSLAQTEKMAQKHISAHDVDPGPAVEIGVEDMKKLEQQYQVGTKAYYHAKYRLEHPHSQFQAAWRAAHPGSSPEEQHAAAKAKYQTEHPDSSHQQYKAKYNAGHADEHTAFKLKYQKEHPKEIEHAKFKAEYKAQASASGNVQGSPPSTEMPALASTQKEPFEVHERKRLHKLEVMRKKGVTPEAHAAHDRMKAEMAAHGTTSPGVASQTKRMTANNISKASLTLSLPMKKIEVGSAKWMKDHPSWVDHGDRGSVMWKQMHNRTIEPPEAVDEMTLAQTEKMAQKHISAHDVDPGPAVEISVEDMKKLEQQYQVGTKAYYHAKYRLEHPHSQFQAAWRAAHPNYKPSPEEQHAAAKAKYQTEHPEELMHQQYKAKYNADHADEHTAFKLKYQKEHPKEIEHAKFKAEYKASLVDAGATGGSDTSKSTSDLAPIARVDEMSLAQTEKMAQKHISAHDVDPGPAVEIGVEDMKKLEQQYQVGTKAYYHAKYRLEHPHSQFQAAWRAAHPGSSPEEQHAAAKAKYQTEHPDSSHQQYKAKYNAGHADEHTAFKLKYQKEHPKEIEHAKFKAEYKAQASASGNVQSESTLPQTEKTVFKSQSVPGVIYSEAWGGPDAQDKKAVWEPTVLPYATRVANVEKVTTATEENSDTLSTNVSAGVEGVATKTLPQAATQTL